MRHHVKTVWEKKFMRFLFVGALNTLFGYALFSLLIFSGLHYAMAVFFSTVGGTLFNFKTTGKIVFRADKNSLLFKFLGVYGVVYLLNVAALKAMAHFGVSMYLAGILLALPMALVSYALNSRLVFRRNL